MNLRHVFLIFGILLTIGTNRSFGQDQPDSVKIIDIAVWDFDTAHPDFEHPSDGGKCVAGPHISQPSNLVEPELGSDKKPVPKDSTFTNSMCDDLRIEDWFHKNQYNELHCKELVLRLKPGTENVYIYDSDNEESKNFFPVDNVPGAQLIVSGDPNNPSFHNYSFCDEAHLQFTYRGGEEFYFIGDDDLFVYINNRIALDLGGTGFRKGGTINLDDQAEDLGIVVGNTYAFDLFHCERRTSASTLRIETSIDLEPADPEGIYLSNRPSSIVKVDSISLLQYFDQPETLYTLLVENAEEQLECQKIVIQKPPELSEATWFVGTQQIGTGSSLPIDASTINPGTHWLKVVRGTYRDSVLLTVKQSNKLPPPVILPADTIYKARVQISISCGSAEPCNIYYCTDCDSPTTSSTLYSEPFSISSSNPVTIRAFAYTEKRGWFSSDPTSKTYLNADTIGPKIADVKYYVGRMPWEEIGPGETGVPDTLIITFDEPVRQQEIRNIVSDQTTLESVFDIQGENPENVVFQNAAIFDTVVQDSGFISVYITLPNNWKVNVNQDSISIKPGQLRDVAGNEALEEKSDIISKPYDLVPRAAPNPFIPDESLIPASILGKVDRSSGDANCPEINRGIIIKILAVDELNPINSSMTIYDATGNVVAEILCGFNDVSSKKFMYFIWDGKNTNGRTVGGGTYLCDVKAKKVANDEEVKKRFKIGVKR